MKKKVKKKDDDSSGGSDTESDSVGGGEDDDDGDLQAAEDDYEQADDGHGISNLQQVINYIRLLHKLYAVLTTTNIPISCCFLTTNRDCVL